MYKVMVRDNMSPVAKKVLEATGKIEVVVDLVAVRELPLQHPIQRSCLRSSVNSMALQLEAEPESQKRY